MPVISRLLHKFASKGIDLTNPPDLLPTGYHPRLMNAVVEQQGALDCRVGSLSLISGISSANGHSVRRLNNLNPSYSALDHILLLGAGSDLYSGDPLNPSAPIATGFSGNPLSIITYRPDQSTAAWAYIADQNKMVKVDVNSTVRNTGILSPSVEAQAELTSLPVEDVVMSGSWTAGGTASANTTPSRIPTTTVSIILYDSGSSGWACLSPQTVAGGYAWLQPGQRLILNSAETVTVEAVLPDIAACTIASILYDSGSTGLCSVALSTDQPLIARNSLIVLGANTVRVLSVSTDTLGNVSFRCSNPGTNNPGDPVVGIVSMRVFTTTTIAATQTITDVTTISFSSTAGTGYQTQTGGQPDLSAISGRAIGPDDYVVIAIKLDNPALLTEGRILLDVDSTTNDFAHNYFYYPFRADDFTAASQGTQPATSAIQSAVVNQAFATADPRNSSAQLSLGSGQWTQLSIRISDLNRVGSDSTRNLSNVAAVRLQVTCTATMVAQFNGWYVAGTYGTDVALGSPTGIYYLYRYRSTATGARSNPSPTPRYQLFPSRQPISIAFTSSSDPQADVIDVFRYDPALQSANTPVATIVYIATIQNSSPTYSDQNVASLIAAQQQVDLNLFQPWPVLAAPITGTCNVCGNAVQWASGGQFPLTMVPGTVITLGAINTKDQHQTYSFPQSATFLQLQDNGGSGTGVPFAIYSPLLAGQPLPILFGPLEGPLATYTFGLGDPLNPGTLYWTNGNDPDSASDQNTLEITSPSEPLIGGCVWNTLVYVFSRDRCFLVRPSFDANGSFTFTFYALSSPSGLWSSWAICAALDGIYFLGRDGIYRIAGEQVQSITDLTLYPLFPHSGKPGQAVNLYQPVDMTQTSSLQLNFAAGDVWFNYIDTGAAYCTWRYDRAMQGWFPQSWPQQVTSLYFESTPQTSVPRLLMTTNTGALLQATGTLDDGAPIVATVRTPSMDGGDPRSQKLYVDLMTDAITPTQIMATIGYDNFTNSLPAQAVPASAVRAQSRLTISTINGTLALHRNIAVEYSFGSGTSLFECEPAGYLQPYLANSFISRHDSGFPDWVTLRDGLFAVISTADLTLTIDIDGSTALSPYTLASTSGNLRKVYQLFRHASKGRMFIWQIQCASPFVLFGDETIVRQKSWTGDFIDTKPFAGGASQP